jgi:uncharacterized membrane protein
MRISDIVVGLAFVLASAGYFFVAAALPASPSLGDPGPAYLPKIIAVVTGVTGVALAVAGLRPRGGAGAKPVLIPASAFILAGWSVLAVALMPLIGTPATLALFVFGGILIQIGRAGLVQGAVSAVLIAAVVYSLFRLLLDVPLP